MSFQIDAQSIKPLAHSIPSISADWSNKDYIGAFKVRWGVRRDNYSVVPGLYKIGTPISSSDVFVSANYKLSFDILRKNLKGFNAWILVIDTKGVNVWCAAGKGTFSTNNIVKQIKNSLLDQIVNHRKLIIPQLGAPGVAAHTVKELTGFRIVYGPIRAKDIKAFIEANYKATLQMRKVTFTFRDRVKLIPVDLMAGMKKLILILFILFFISGLDNTGFIFDKMLKTSLYPLLNITGAYLAGIIIAPLLLPVIPFRAFALKGAIWGLAITLVLSVLFQSSYTELLNMGLLNISLASYVTMNFTGSSTYTSLSGVKKEMKWAVPFQMTFVVAGFILFIISKLW